MGVEREAVELEAPAQASRSIRSLEDFGVPKMGRQDEAGQASPEDSDHAPANTSRGY